MKLSELIRIKNILYNIQQSIREELKNQNLLFGKNFVDSLSQVDFQKRQIIIDCFNSIEAEKIKIISFLNSQIIDVEAMIDARAQPLMNFGYTINNQVSCSISTPENERLFRFSLANVDVKNKIKAQIANKTNPRFAALEIGPGDGQWTEYLVAADPLYLVDVHEEFIKSTLSKFPIEYQARLRPYLIGFNEDKENYLDQLPQQQFGFVFAWNVFDFLPPDIVEKYLFSVYEILRPGGSFLFSYNNCENPVNAKYAEIGFKGWMTKNLLEKLSIKYSYIIENFDSHDHVNWAILRKPGNLTSVKALQTLGKIISF
jgi:SAM-dependent methyltransferase